jgi:hypothetical protein
VRLSKQSPEVQNSSAPGKPTESVVLAQEIYKLYFHGPAYQVLERAWRDAERIVGQFAKNLPGNHFPTGKPLLLSPRLIELCFQTAGLWEMSIFGRMGLPNHIERVALLRAPEATAELFAVVHPAANGENFDAEIIDTRGIPYLQLSGYRTVALPNRVEAESLRALQTVVV